MRIGGLALGLALVLAPLNPVSAAESLESDYARLCAGDVRNETCDVLRRALLAKLNAASDPTPVAAAQGGAEDAIQTRLARWGVQGREAQNGKQLFLNKTMSPGDEFSYYSFGATLFEYEWLDETRLKKTTRQLDVTSFNWGYGAKGAASPIPPEYLMSSEEILTLDESQGKILVEQHWLTGAVKGQKHRYQLDINPLENYGKDFSTQYPLNGKQGYMEVRHQGDNREMVSGTIEAGGRKPSSYARTLTVAGLSDPQIRSLIAEEKQRFHATISQLHQRQSSSDGWLKALIGAGVGIAAGKAHGLDASQTAGAALKGIQVTGGGGAMGQAMGAVGEELIAGNRSAAAPVAAPGVPSAGAAAYATRPNLATGACAGFTEENYRSKALQGGGDSQLYTMCGQAFEYYTMYKRAIAQGYSEADANRTYEAHEKSARVATSYLQSHGS